MIGLEIDEAQTIAVSVDSDGRVLARAVATGAPATSAPVVLRELKADGSPIVAACPVPDAPFVAPAIVAILRELTPPPTHAIAEAGIGAVSQRLSVAPSGIAAAIAESWVGAARGARDVVFFAVAEHSIAGIVRDGVPVTGFRGRAATIAWMALNPVEREDYRKVGCLEAEVAAAGIVRRLIWRIKAGDRSRVQEAAGGDLSAISIDHVLEGARGGDGVSISVMRDTAKYMGMAAANLVALVDPEVLVLGGIMASAADLLFDPVRTELARRIPASMMQALTIVPASLGADAAAIGAARMAAAARQ